MRRVIVGADDIGKSIVLSDEDIADVGRIWDVDPAVVGSIVGRIADKDVYVAFQPPAGGMIWHMANIPPGGARTNSRELGPMDKAGFHVTKTVDFIYVLDEGLILDLDDGRLHLAPGDVVLLQAARHSWGNDTNTPVRFLDLLVDVS